MPAPTTDRPPDEPAPTPEPGEERVFSGKGVAPGIAIGPAFLFSTPDFEADPVSIAPDDAETEVARYEAAVERSERELGKIATFAREKLGEASAEIFEAQRLALRDPTVREAVLGRIAESRCVADYAVQAALDEARRRLAASPNEYLRARAGDLADIKNRLLRNLRQARAFSRIEPDRVVVAEDLTAADVLLFSRRAVLGIATDFGGPTSHVSIMARALGVPAVVSLHGLSPALAGGETVVLDGFHGRVIVDPSEETLAAYRERREQYRLIRAGGEEVRDLPAETEDGTRVALRANLELPEEVPLLERYGAEGVGLFRTEMLLLAKGSPLGEAEQLAVYREVVRAARPHATTLRLIDLGGDKFLPMAHREHNPFLGWRGVRVLLDKPEVLRPQLRAVLQAATEGPVRILIPMVSSLEEVHRLRSHLADAVRSLQADGLDHDADVPLGVMVEVPSVALAADRYAAEVDFLSVGTNDLTQFTLAVDRGNDLVAGRYRELHPVVLRLVRETVEAGRRHGVPVSLCGEMAGNPRVAPLLVGLGLRELSASPSFLPDVKRAIRSTTLADAEALAEQALAQPDAQSVRTLADQWMREHVPELAPFFDGDAGGT